MSGIKTLLTAVLVLLVSTMGEIGLGAPVATTPQMTQGIAPVFVKEAEVRKESRPTLTKQEHDPPAVIGGIDMGGTGTFRSDKEADDSGGTHIAYSMTIAGQGGTGTKVVEVREIDKVQPQLNLQADAMKKGAHSETSTDMKGVHAREIRVEQLKYEGMYA